MIYLFNYLTIIFVFFLFFNFIECLNFIIPLPNTVIFAGTSSLVTWSIGTSNLTSTNLYLANGADPNNLIVFSILGQNLPSSKTSMMANIPKNAPNDNTFLLLEGNDTPASRATVPLNIVFGNSNSTVSPIPTASTIPTPSPNITTTTTMKPTTTSSTHSSSTKPSNTSPTPSESTSPSSSDSLGSSTIIGVVIGGVVAIGLVGAIILICLRRQKRKREKRHTELFDDKGIDFTGYHEDTNHYQNTSPSSQQQYYHHHQQQQQQPSPFLSPTESYPMDQMNYARSMTYNQPPPAVLQYPMKTIDSTNMRDNGFQSRTQLENVSPSTIIVNNNNDSTMTFNSKPNEIDSQKPHAK